MPDQLFRTLSAAVLDGTYQPGDKLPTQRALAAEHGVNMATVREAVKQLESLRLIETRHGEAMTVTDWRTSVGLDVLVHAAASFPQFTEAALPGVFEARRLLLVEAARLAATRRSDEQAQQLTELAEQLTDSPTPHADLEFMTTVVQASQNLIFALILNSIRALYLGNLHLFPQMVAADDEYAEIAAAIEQHDDDRAAELMRVLADAHGARVLG